MADHSVNPLCSRRLDELEGGHKELEIKVEEHGDHIAEHALQLRQHDDRMNAIEKTVEAMAATVMNSDKSLAVIASSVEAIKTEVTRINGWQTKLIGFSFVVLAILAGVEEAHKIGLL
jgi:septal ring factor EnvC (AmiA/AmiB activator)